MGTTRAARGARAASAVRRAQAGRPLPSRRPAGPPLTAGERARIVTTFLTLVDDLYAHLPLKQAMYGIDPAQRLRLLLQRTSDIDDDSLHDELIGIVTELRDAHTRYIGPTRLAGHTARLPFLVESYGPATAPSYVVSKVSAETGDPHFVAGVELEWWNGVPIDRAVEIYAQQETGGRPDSRRARALQTLTLRSLQFGRPPDEHWVIVGYRDLGRSRREVRFDWRLVAPGRAPTASRSDHAEPLRRLAMAIDPGAEAARRTKKLLFAPEPWLADQRAGSVGPAPAAPPTPTPTPATPATEGDAIDTPFQDAVTAKSVRTRIGRIGYLRLWSFDVADDVSYVDEVVRLLELLPDRGLIVDLRGNPGGLVWAAERLLQLLSPRPIVPTRFSLRATSLTRAMAAAGQNELTFAPWRASLAEAVSTGEPYSRAAPLTPVDRCNDIGQVYGGPVVAVVDPNTYSAGDLFAAGFVDNGLGPLVTVGTASGGGGANVWMPGDLDHVLGGTPFALPALPGGVGYTIAARRALRSGQAEGTAIEDLGVTGTHTYEMQRADLLEDNQGLRRFCAKILADLPWTRLQLRTDLDAGHVEVVTQGLDRIELRADDRSLGSTPITDGTTTLDLPEGWTTAEITAYDGTELRQRRLLRA
jgi:C-terminal processing protease CtpA/Prc